MTIITTTAHVHGWGTSKYARRVAGLTRAERAAIRAGETVLIEGCPEYRGITTRRVVEIKGRFYTRMPA